MGDYVTLHVDTNDSKATAYSNKEYGCDWKCKTIQHYTQTQIEVKKMRDYTTLHSDTHWSKWTACSTKE
jgi:hypothetical protein